MSRKFLQTLMSLLIASLGALPASAAAQVGSGVPGKFAPCMDSGYQTLVRSNGTSFANLGSCVSYAVRGGALFRAIDASSVYTMLRGFGGPLSPPDANGDRVGSTGDGGMITGGFSFGGTCVPQFPNTVCFNFGMLFLGYVLHTTTGVADGNGTASCDPCSVGGRTGTLSFATTLVGHPVPFDGDVFVALDGGTWQITSGIGDLAATSGSGTWTQQTNGTRTFTGSTLSRVN
jgi:hypothetical protein